MELREKQGWPKALIGLAARLPWWLGLALAVLAYGGLHHLAQKPVGNPQPGQMGSFALSAVAAFEKTRSYFSGGSRAEISCS